MTTVVMIENGGLVGVSWWVDVAYLVWNGP